MYSIFHENFLIFENAILGINMDQCICLSMHNMIMDMIVKILHSINI